MEINITNEYDKLKSVIVASANYFDPNTLALNNETIKYYSDNNKKIDKNKILSEQDKFWTLLKKFEINILVASNVDGAKGQMFTRDLAFVIGNKFFISNMKKENRKKAINGWTKIIEQINPKDIVNVPSNIFLEGGDVIIDNKTVYVGISERTTMEGVKFLKKTLGSEYQVIPLKLKPKFLHLDVVFTIINPNLALIYKDVLEDESYKLLEKYEKIEITKAEQFELATNVFVIERNKIIMNSSHKRIKKFFKIKV